MNIKSKPSIKKTIPFFFGLVGIIICSLLLYSCGKNATSNSSINKKQSDKMSPSKTKADKWRVY